MCTVVQFTRAISLGLIVIVGWLASLDTASAQTVAMYRFDTMADAADGLGGLTLFDTVAGHDFVSSDMFGSVLLSTDAPGLAAPNAYAFNSLNGGAQLLTTPAANVFHRGYTGELSVEFWFKSTQVTDGLAYILSFDGGDSGSATGDWGIYSDNAGSLHFYESSNTVVSIATGAAASDGGWHHVGFTIDGVGVARSYLDGGLVAQSLATGAAVPARADVLKFGRSSLDGHSSHAFLIDDLRISGGALASGTGSGVGELAWNASLSVPRPPAVRPADFGRQWVREHPFTIGAWGFTDYPTLYTDAHFNTALGGGHVAAHDAGVLPAWVGAMTQLNDQTRTEIEIALNAGTRAFLLRDELPIDEIPGFVDVADHIRSIDSDALIIAGLAASSPGYVDQVMTQVQPDAVVHGFYPFPAGDQHTTDHWYRGGLSDVALVRERALFYDVPYFAYIQSFDDQLASPNPPGLRRRLPSESELRAELFTKLSAGIKGFFYFVFQDGVLEDIALVDPSGVTSPLYAPAALANAEVARLGGVMRHLESTDWRFVSGGGPARPEYMTDLDASVGDGRLLGVALDGPAADLRDAVVGFFTDDAGGQYFMLVNTFHGKTLTAHDAEVTFTLTFAESVEAVWRLNRLTGDVEQLALTGHTLTVTLPGGTGDLFKFDDGAFVPEPGVAVTLLTVGSVLIGRRGRTRGRSV